MRTSAMMCQNKNATQLMRTFALQFRCQIFLSRTRDVTIKVLGASMHSSPTPGVSHCSRTTLWGILPLLSTSYNLIVVLIITSVIWRYYRNWNHHHQTLGTGHRCVSFCRTGKMSKMSKLCPKKYFLVLHCDQTVQLFQLFSTVLKRFCPAQSKNSPVLVLAHCFD